MFIPGRFILSTQTNDLTCWLCYRPSDGLHFPVTMVAEGIMADLWRDFWMRETGTGQQVAQLHDKYDDDDDNDGS
jgi:hypothetical protein